MGKVKTAITPTREENYPEWYQKVIQAADLAENSSVRGCMVIKPWGFALWEKIRDILDKKFKETGIQNAYFPLFIPLSYLEKEASHVEGFAKECAVVTHHRLEKKGDKLVPTAPLEEPYVVRPTSEMIIGESFAKWIQSYRDLPILINQWANVVRWEMRPRIFLRTAEFLWQEGHTAHATQEEAEKRAKEMLNMYVSFCHEILALPVIPGEKSEREKFPGAVTTYTFEAMMQDGKALQGGTSHFLGQNFAKAAKITYRDAKEQEQYTWTTSWGVTTRLIGALIMTHADDDGLILPPRLASTHIVILPLIHKEEVKEEVLHFCEGLKKKLSHCTYHGETLGVHIDKRDLRGGEKFWSWVKKGVPIRIEVGPKEVQENTLAITKRTKPHKQLEHQTPDHFVASIEKQLDEMQKTLYQKALKYRDDRIHKIETKEDFETFFAQKNTLHTGGFASMHFCQDPKLEEEIQKAYGVTVRCIPHDMPKEKGTCPFTGKESQQRVLFAKAY